MLHLHHLAHSRSFRILWLLEELGLDYQLTTYERTTQYLAPKALQNIAPLGKAPILTDGEKVLTESGFIIEYLLKKYDTNHTLKPRYASQPNAWESYTFWLHFAEASAMPNLVMRLIFQKIAADSPFPANFVAKKIRDNIETRYLADTIKNTLNIMEQHLAQYPWFAHETFSAADIQMYFVGWAGKQRAGLSPTTYPNLSRWLTQCETRPTFQQAINKGGAL